VENAKVALRASDQRRTPVLLNASVVRDERGRFVQSRMSLRDVSDVERAEASRAAVVHDAMDAIITIDGQGTVVEYNPAAAEMFGYSADEAKGRYLSDLIVPERFKEPHTQGLARFRATGEGPILGQRIELDARRRDGTEFPVELSVVKLEGTERLLFTGFVRDLTRLKRAQKDLESTIADLRRSNEDLEQFAYVASHDLQEPLRMVTVFMEMLDAQYGGRLDPEAERYITYAVEGAERLRRLVDGLLAYSRIGTRGASPEPCACGGVVDEALRNLALRVEETRATIRVGDLPTVWADATQLQQVFMNLLSNALKFHGDEAPAIDVRCRRDGQHWEFVVEDNGIGFDPGQENRIFQMFQRLHARQKYEGSGIGLAVAKRIVERHGGRMWAVSKPGKGASFHFVLPATRSAPETCETPPPRAPDMTQEDKPIGAQS
jgi:PAS domain S-box-containing protein